MEELRVKIEPAVIATDSDKPALVTAVFTDDGIPLIGEEVYFCLEGDGYLVNDVDQTDAYGEARCWFYAGKDVGKSEITAYAWRYE